MKMLCNATPLLPPFYEKLSALLARVGVGTEAAHSSISSVLNRDSCFVGGRDPGSVEISLGKTPVLTLSLADQFEDGKRVSIYDHNLYMHCLPTVSNFRMNEIDRNLVFHQKWLTLKVTSISNPQKDVVFKFFHNRGLTPSIAKHKRFYFSKNCPFCSFHSPKLDHFLICPTATPLWGKLDLIFNKVIKQPSSSASSSIFHGTRHEGVNICIFLAFSTIYKKLWHSLNRFKGHFDLLSKYRHSLFARILAEYTSSKNFSLSSFEKRFGGFKIYSIKSNGKIDIDLSFLT